MQSGLFDLKAELIRKEEQLVSKKQNVPAEKSNKTFSKISALTGKQKKKLKNDVSVSLTSDKEIDDESAALFEKARAKLEAKSRLYEKMHSGEMEDLENIYGETTFLVDFHKKSEDEKNDENKNGKKKSFETKGSYALFEADEENRERLREKWAREQQEILDGPVHYENIKFDEVRNLGTGYFAFSKDEQTRKEQLEELNKLRENTKNIQNKKEILNNKRKALLEDRLAKVRQKKLGKIDIETNIDQNESNNKKLTLDQTNLSDVSKSNELESNTADINTFIQECRKQTKMTREWDKGKHETYVEQTFVKPSISYEKIIHARRQDRNEDFAPPNFY
ncbi:coiled-coil domain-containing protein 174 [Hydra vulgaris]|uniref:coiled-coil domain-containing protein 174 n=1 Tax=Hydra vulgaris TaxID=6087 RepID=UPI001F5E52C2|nr:coiled-coil domain-containing protein 174 [Hydra vulgaris]